LKKNPNFFFQIFTFLLLFLKQNSYIILDIAPKIINDCDPFDGPGRDKLRKFLKQTNVALRNALRDST
jgi:hypothetical protein